MRSKFAFYIWSTGAALIVAQLLSGCATTNVIAHWQDPDYTAGPFKKMVIFIAAKDDAVRRSTEDEAVHNLTGTTTGLASYTLYPDQEQISKENKEAIKARLTSEGVDGALVVRLQSVKKDTVYVPPQVNNSYDSFYGYSGYAYGYSYMTPGYSYVTPGYAYDEVKYIIEARVYELPEGKMIWSTTTESVSPDSKQQLIKEVGQILREDLIRDKIIAN